MTNITIVSIEPCAASMIVGRCEQNWCFSNYARHHEEQFNKIKSEIKSGIYSAVKNVSQNKKVFAKTTAERNEERGNVLRHQNTFLIANFAEPGEVNCDLLEIISSTSRFKNIPPKRYFGRAVRLARWDREGVKQFTLSAHDAFGDRNHMHVDHRSKMRRLSGDLH